MTNIISVLVISTFVSLAYTLNKYKSQDDALAGVIINTVVCIATLIYLFVCK